MGPQFVASTAHSGSDFRTFEALTSFDLTRVSAGRCKNFWVLGMNMGQLATLIRDRFELGTIPLNMAWSIFQDICAAGENN